MGYVELALAIIGEVIGTNFMKASNGFTKLLPSSITVIAYLACFFFLAQSVKNSQFKYSLRNMGWSRNYSYINHCCISMA